MAGTFTQLFCHGIMAVKFRQSLIEPSWEKELFRTMGNTLKELGHTPIIINGTDDHVHALWSHHKTKSYSETMKFLKGRSSKYINDNFDLPDLFRWQAGYGAFSVSVDRVPTVQRYILRQKEHHRKEGLHPEYARILHQHGVEDIREHAFAQLEDGPMILRSAARYRPFSSE